MNSLKRIVALGSGVAAVMVLNLAPLLAQEPGAPSSATTAPAIARRVPRYYGQIGLTPEQKETIYAIQARHKTRIVQLQAQIDQINAQMEEELQGVLTESQRVLLEQRRGSARSRSRTAPAPVEPPATATDG